MAEEIRSADDERGRMRRQRRLLVVSFLVSVLLLLCCMVGVAVLGSRSQPAEPAPPAGS